MRRFEISDVRFTAAPQEDVRRGLLGWTSCTINGTLRLDGLALRRTLDGRRTLSFPGRRDAVGRLHFFLRPLDDATRHAIEAQVFEALGLEEGARG